MDLRRLRYAMALAEHGGFGRAAAALGISQPSLSRQIALLERELGFDLFVRTNAGATPTAAGLSIIAAAGDAILLLDQARVLAAQAGRGESGELSIGFIGSALYEVLLSVLPRFQSAHPNVRLMAIEMSSAAAAAALERGELDVAFGRGAHPAPHPADIRSVPLVRSNVAAIMSRRHPLAGQEKLTVQQVAAHPLVIANDSEEPASLGAVAALIDENTRNWQKTTVTRDIRTMASLVGVGMGIGLGPDSLRAVAGADLWVAEVTPRIAMPELHVTVRATTLSAPAQEFLRVLAKTVPAAEAALTPPWQ